MSNKQKNIGRKEEEIFDICNKFKSIDNFIRLYREGKWNDTELAQYPANIVNNMIDSDFSFYSENYSQLITAIYGEENLSNILYMYSSNEIKEKLQVLNKREERIIIDIFGLVDGKEKTLRELEKTENVGHERIRQIRDKALRKLKCFANSTKGISVISLNDLKNNELILDEEKMMLSELEEDIWNSSIIIKKDAKSEKEESIDETEKEDFNLVKEKILVINDIQKSLKLREQKKKEQMRESSIEDFMKNIQ